MTLPRRTIAVAILFVSLESCHPAPLHSPCALSPQFMGPTRSGERSVLVMSYNIKGLPRIAGGGNNDGRYRAIANALRGYDIVALQEVLHHRDFLIRQLPNGYSAAYRSSNRGLVSLRVYGNGLAVVGQTQRLDRRSARQVKFSHCAGWFDGANDCLARKGLLRVPYSLDNGDTLDVFTVHLDADNREADRAVRATQLTQARETIAALSGQRPIVVLGDFNVPRGSVEESQLASFRDALGLTDTNTLVAASCSERIDYIFFRSGRHTQLHVAETGIDARAMGSPALSDHPPIYAVLVY